MTAQRTVITTQNVTAAVDVLYFLKSRYNYRKLSKLLGISQSTLARYLHRKTVPRPRVAREIMRRALEIIRPEELVREYVESYRDRWSIRLASDGQALKILAYHALGAFEGTRVVAAANLDPPAIPLTVAFSLVTGCGLVLVGERPMCDTEEYFPVTYKPKGDYSSRHLWVPSVIKSYKDGVLVFASSVGSPHPLTDFISLLQDKGIRCSGVYSLLAREEVWNSVRFPVGCRKKAVLVER
ncbi:MAG: hypothetical protein NZ733_01015 [Aigarchaeota archaeon]|nr:hypothetical protein [Aigarchaeota archaeon]MCX8203094.1 hypothetical protein [Nitrososphaeria archaeon]MDW8043416.1 hypothetical protein [Nitrososphaerota archaeon]